MVASLGKMLVGLSLLALLGCSQAPRLSPTDTGKTAGFGSVYTELARKGETVFSIDPKSSSVRIYVFRSGRVAKLGHNHVVTAPRFAGYAHLPRDGVADARFDLEFRLDQLEFDEPALRALLGSAFATSLSPEAIAATREHMLSEANMQASRFPIATIHALEVAGELPKLAARVLIDMHGRQREQWVPLSVEGLPDRLAVAGSLVLKQTDFGIQPYSALGGLLAVKDEVVVEFHLVGHVVR
jgi:hypothetical protein